MNSSEAVNRENLLAWVQDIESGKHRQANGVLRCGVENPQYCCLGRLCEVAMENDVSIRRVPDRTHIGRFGYTGHADSNTATAQTSRVPYPVTEWLGGQLRYGDLSKYAVMNDNGQTFLEIAAAIREDFDLGPREDA